MTIKTAVLSNGSPIGLTIIRELGEHGVPVHVIGVRPDSIGRKSRHCQDFSLRPAGALKDWLPTFVARNQIGAVMGISEETLVELAQLHGKMPNCTIISPKLDRLALVLDKSATLAVARKVGMDVPDSWQPLDIEGRDDHAATLIYPCAIKWADPVAIVHLLAAAGLPFEKVEYAADAAELIAILRRYDDLGVWPLVQEFVGGYGIGQMIHMQGDKVTLAFQHRRLREWPPSGGVSTYCASVPLEEHALQRTLSEALLREIGWEGPAMVEYRFDPVTGRTCLMEINGRFWGSIPLAYHCGAHFAWETWRCAMDVPFTRQASIRTSRARYMVPDTKHLWVQMKSPEMDVIAKIMLLAAFLLRLLDPNTHYYVWSLRDPAPFLSDIKSIIRKVVHRDRSAPDPAPQIPPAAGTPA